MSKEVPVVLISIEGQTGDPTDEVKRILKRLCDLGAVLLQIESLGLNPLQGRIRIEYPHAP